MKSFFEFMKEKSTFVGYCSSVLFLFYLQFVVSPYAERLNLFSTGSYPSPAQSDAYISFFLPKFILYLIITAIVVCFSFKYNFKLRAIFYPLCVLNVLYGLLLWSVYKGGTVLFILGLLFVVAFLVLMPVSFSIGLAFDLSKKKTHKK